MFILAKVVGNLIGVLFRKNLLSIDEVIEIFNPLEGLEVKCSEYEKIKEFARKETEAEE